MTRRRAGDSWLRGTRLYYDSREHLWLAIAEKWQVDELGNPTNCQRTSAMEYRYDEARARYMVRPRNPVTMQIDDAAAGSWHDYDGVDIYSDYTISVAGGTPSATARVAHAAGLGQFDLDAAAGAAKSYFHGNLIGTNEAVTGSTGVLPVTARRVFTAFGEPVYVAQPPSAGNRYGYAGAWGYQAPSGTADPLSELGWLHVGERYYDPAAGRFMQRDPIGIRGGTNAYIYAENLPTQAIDPSGLAVWSNRPPGNQPPNLLPRPGVWPNTPARLPTQQELINAALQKQVAELQKQIDQLRESKADREDDRLIRIQDPRYTDPTGTIVIDSGPLRRNCAYTVLHVANFFGWQELLGYCVQDRQLLCGTALGGAIVLSITPPLTLLLLVAGLVAGWMIGRLLVGRVVVQDGYLCPRCGYSLLGSPKLLCPECGSEIRLDELGVSEADFRRGQRLWRGGNNSRRFSTTDAAKVPNRNNAGQAPISDTHDTAHNA